MFHPVMSRGGLLPGGDPTDLHDRVMGVRYRTEAEKAAQMAQVVKPFKSLQVEQPKRAPSTAGVPPAQRVHTNSQSNAPSSARSRITTPAATSGTEPATTVKKDHVPRPVSAASRSSSTKKSVSLKKRPATSTSAAASASVEYLRSSAAVAPSPPSWLSSAVHPPRRPNAPSEMDASARAARHATETTRPKKSHKLITQPYPKPKDDDASHSDIVIERHARPILVHGKDRREDPTVKFVPIGHIVSVRPKTVQEKEKNNNSDDSRRIGFANAVAPDSDVHVDLTVNGSNGRESFTQSATPGQLEERYMSFTPYQGQEVDQPPPNETRAAKARQSFEAMQKEFRPHGLFSQVQQQPSHTQQQQLQYDPSQPSSSPSAAAAFPHSRSMSMPPLSSTLPSSGLTTPHVHTTIPEPYSHATAFDAQNRNNTNDELPTNAPPNLSVRTPTEPAYTITPINVDSNTAASEHTAAANLMSPSPPRHVHPPQPTSMSSPSPSSSHASSDVLAGPMSPIRARALAAKESLDADLARRKLEAEHEKQMKSYLSPTSRPQARRNNIPPTSSKKSPSAAMFTPNPYARHVESDEMKSNSSGLFYDPVTERPPDLPPADPRVGLARQEAKSLYPSIDSDPHRSLAAALRGPRLKYDPPTSCLTDWSHTMSPQASPIKHAKEGEEEPHVWLGREMKERAIQRQALEKEKKALWQEKWNRIKQTSQANASYARGAMSPTAARLLSQTKDHSSVGAGGDAQKVLTFDFTNDKRLNVDEPHTRHPSMTSSTATHLTPPSSSFDRDSSLPVSSTPVPTQFAPIERDAKSSTPIPSTSGIDVVQKASSTGHTPPTMSGGRTAEPIILAKNNNPHLTAAVHRRTQSNTGRPTGPTETPIAPSPAPSSSASNLVGNVPISPSQLPPVRRIVVGSTNATKINAVRSVVDRIFSSVHSESWLTRSGRERSPSPDVEVRLNEVTGIEVASGVAAQPLSSEETKAGALYRAKAVLRADPTAEYGVGIEGGIEHVGDQWFESGWIAVVDRTGKVGIGTSARFEISESIARELLTGRTELCEIVDRLSGLTGVRSKQGFMGVVTNNLLPRAECYEQGVIFAFAPFISSPVYWS